MENITAEEFVKEYLYITKDAEEGEEESVHDSISNVVDLIISFAKGKCEEMQKAILNNANLYLNPDNNEWEIENDSIRNAYDINNIK